LKPLESRTVNQGAFLFIEFLICRKFKHIRVDYPMAINDRLVPGEVK
jgi:hypothetical protein